MIDWWFIDDLLMIYWWLIDDWLMIDWLLLDWWLIDDSWWLIDDWLMIYLLYIDRWLKIDDWLIIDDWLLIDDWLIDDYWIIIDWWLMIDYLWLMDDWLTIDWCLIDDWLLIDCWLIGNVETCRLWSGSQRHYPHQVMSSLTLLESGLLLGSPGPCLNLLGSCPAFPWLHASCELVFVHLGGGSTWGMAPLSTARHNLAPTDGRDVGLW